MNFSFSNAQIILAFLALLFFIRSIYRYTRRVRGQTFFKFVLSIIIWIGVFITALFPAFAHVIVKVFGLGENFNTLIFAAFVIVFLFLFVLVSLHEKTERKITRIIRIIALKQFTDEYHLTKK